MFKPNNIKIITNFKLVEQTITPLVDIDYKLVLYCLYTGCLLSNQIKVLNSTH